MKFSELKFGQAFWFSAFELSPLYLLLSAGVEGNEGRFVSSYSDPNDSTEWLFCSADAEVIPETIL